MTQLRKIMLEELQRRNYAPSTVHNYIHAIEDFARYFGRSPYYLGPNHIRQYQAYLFRDRKLLAQTVRVRTAALRFLYVKTLKRPYLHEQIPFPKIKAPMHAQQREAARKLAPFGGSMPDLGETPRRRAPRK